MILINNTLSFDAKIQAKALQWIHADFIPLAQECSYIEQVKFFSILSEPDADECFALQFIFSSDSQYQNFTSSYQNRFDEILFAAFPQSVGMYRTVLVEHSV